MKLVLLCLITQLAFCYSKALDRNYLRDFVLNEIQEKSLIEKLNLESKSDLSSSYSFSLQEKKTILDLKNYISETLMIFIEDGFSITEITSKKLAENTKITYIWALEKDGVHLQMAISEENFLTFISLKK